MPPRWPAVSTAAGSRPPAAGATGSWFTCADPMNGRRTTTAPPAADRGTAAGGALIGSQRRFGNGRYRLLLTTAGTGGSWLGDQALTAWRGDPIEDADGWFAWLRDRDDGRVWSIAARPGPGAGRGRVEADGGGMTFVRVAHGIDARMEVWVDPELDAECRRITIANAGDRERHVDLTGYLEVVLHDPSAHAAHPMFSRLFLRTEWLADRGALIAHRRSRTPGETHPWLVQQVIGGVSSVETDRARFLGRHRGIDDPVALAGAGDLSGTVGDVLDPVFATRSNVTLAPGASARIGWVLAAAASREEALAIAARLATRADLDRSRRRADEAAGRPAAIESPGALD